MENLRQITICSNQGSEGQQEQVFEEQLYLYVSHFINVSLNLNLEGS